MSTKSLSLDHPLFQIATNMSQKLGFNIYPRSNMNINMFTLREGITDFVLDKEDEDDEDE